MSSTRECVNHSMMWLGFGLGRQMTGFQTNDTEPSLAIIIFAPVFIGPALYLGLFNCTDLTARMNESLLTKRNI